jgi:hypothetical protein
MVRVVGGSEGCSRLFNVVLRGYYIVEIECLLAEQLDGMQNVNQRGPSVLEVVGLGAVPRKSIRTPVAR